jgi:hypothetical protein
MQTFRAYLENPAGTITWAAWIEADHLDEAVGKAADICPGGPPTVELWSATERKLSASCRLDPV